MFGGEQKGVLPMPAGATVRAFLAEFAKDKAPLVDRLKFAVCMVLFGMGEDPDIAYRT